MDAKVHCPVAGCGKEADALAPHHDPFDEVRVEHLVTPRMTPACHEHVDVFWNFYRTRVSMLLMESSRAREPVSEEAIVAVAWNLNSHNDPLSKSVAALLAQ